MIYEPAEDSYLLQECVKELVKPGMKVLDMGTGSGIQALTAVEIVGAKNVIAVDINPEAVRELCKKKIMAVDSDLYENIPENDDGKFDVVIFNPPYLPKDEREDEESQIITTGGKEGNEITKRFLKESKKHLREKGKVLIVVSTLTPRIEEILREEGWEYKILKEKKVFMETLKVYECWRK